MSQTIEQFVSANSTQPPAGIFGTFAPAPHFNQTGNRARPILRLEIRRSLQLHRRLAIGLALLGLALALIYTLNSWSIHTAQNMNRIRPANSGAIAESSLAMDSAPVLQRAKTVEQFVGRDLSAERQFQNSVTNGSGPGFSGLVAAAVAPWSFPDSGVIRNALVLLLSFAFLGGVIAIVAHRADPRVYIASDVEQLLGFKPMAQLPDFTEVANEVAEECLSRLASGIESALKERRLLDCVFTGTGPEAGVTTITTRLKKLLESTGRAAVIIDASSSSNSAFGAAGHGKDLEGNHQGIVLIDAAPLTDSEETERLVQTAHCTIVVIESGVTTRAQLRAVANILQRAKAPAVGFVLNRVRLATADPAFRRSIKESERQLRKQGHATDWQMLQTLEQAIEKGRASLDIEVAASSNQSASKPQEKIASDAPTIALPPQESRRDRELASTNRNEPAVQGEVQIPQDGQRWHAEPPMQASEEIPFQARKEIPSSLARIAAQFNHIHPEPQIERTQVPPAAPSALNGNGASCEPASAAPEKTLRVSLPRLSELRGMRFSQALRELDHGKRPEQPNAGIETLMNAIAPFEPMFTAAEPPSVTNGDSPDAAPAGLDLPPALRAFIPILEPRDLPQAVNGTAVNGNRANGDHLQSNSGSSKPEPHTQTNGHREEDRERSRLEKKGAREKPGNFLEQLEILPSRRGQYKKKS
ncbi:MAG TPA: hypothetical protein VGG45_20225 [Terracidiphilus sp.]|jgi:hypothetical protein